MKKVLLLVVVLVGLGAALYYSQTTRVEHAKYKVVTKQGKIEIRQYPELIYATALVPGNRDNSLQAGFRNLFDYITGKNKNKQQIAMTAPVMHFNQSTDETPQWAVQFMMPSKFNYEQLPDANANNVLIEKTEAGSYIVIRFSGKNTDENLQQHLNQLTQHIDTNDIEITGGPIYAFYNPPWTLPFFRRNEIMFELVK